MQSFNWQKSIKYFLVTYSLILLAFCFCIIPNSDSYYYWGWSKNLQLSYFDGPPLIAYFIRGATSLFGHTVFAINFVGVIVLLFTCLIVYQIARLLMNKSAAILLALFWLMYPFMITRYTVVNVTYDCLENMFNLLVLFFAVRYIKTRQIINMYYIGVAAGFLLLSKYSGIISLVAILGFFTYYPELRKIFRQKHIYLSMLICLIIFSPVLIWNYQHGFISFIYQLHHHQWAIQAAQSAASNKHGFGKIWYFLGSAVLAPLALCFILILWVFILKCLQKDDCYNINSSISTPHPTITISDKIITAPHSVIPMQACVWEAGIQKIKAPEINQLAVKLILTIAGAIFIFWLCLSPFVQVNLIYTLYFSSLVIIYTGYLLVQASQIRILILCVLVGTICNIQLLYHFSVVAQSIENYHIYVGDGANQLKFNSPLIKSIRP